MIASIWAAGAATLLAMQSDGQPASHGVQAPPKSESSASVTIPVGSPVIIELVAPLSSKDAKTGEAFPIRLAQPLMDGNAVLIPAGVLGMGEVVHAAKGGWDGRGGELLLAARYVEFAGVKVKLRRLRLGGSGQDFLWRNQIPTGYITHGREIEFPAGTRAEALVAVETELPMIAPSIMAKPALDKGD